MVSDRIYELCQPVLDDEDLGDEEKTDKLEDVLSSAPASSHFPSACSAAIGAKSSEWMRSGAECKPPSRAAVSWLSMR